MVKELYEETKFIFRPVKCLSFVLLGACGQKESQTGKGMKSDQSFYPIYAIVKEIWCDMNDSSDSVK